MIYQYIYIYIGTIALSYPPRVRVRATVKLSAAFFHDESSITIRGVRKCNSAYILHIILSEKHTVKFFEKKTKSCFFQLVYVAS